MRLFLDHRVIFVRLLRRIDGWINVSHQVVANPALVDFVPGLERFELDYLSPSLGQGDRLESRYE